MFFGVTSFIICNRSIFLHAYQFNTLDYIQHAGQVYEAEKLLM